MLVGWETKRYGNGVCFGLCFGLFECFFMTGLGMASAWCCLLYSSTSRGRV